MHPYPAAIQTGRDHACVVQDHEFVTSKEGWKLRELPVCDLTAGPVEAEEARGVARFQGMLGDLLWWKTVIEVVEPHGGQSNSKL